jgi:hypothetical protein
MAFGTGLKIMMKKRQTPDIKTLKRATFGRFFEGAENSIQSAN